MDLKPPVWLFGPCTLRVLQQTGFFLNAALFLYLPRLKPPALLSPTRAPDQKKTPRTRLDTSGLALVIPKQRESECF